MKLTGPKLRFLVLLTGILVYFQNCSDNFEVQQEDLNSFAASLPFAFDNKIDHISYMSCSGIPAPNLRSHFTFKVGAYRSTSGLRLRSEFRQAVDGYEPSEMADMLAQSTSNQGATLQVAIRNNSNLTQILHAGNSDPVAGYHFFNMLAPLDSEAISERLTSMDAGQRINYFSGVSGGGRLVEGALDFSEDQTLERDVRNWLSRDTKLTLTYASDTKESPYEPLVNVDSDERAAFGKSYQISTFRTRRVITAIDERSLEDGQSTGTWYCPASLQLQIVRQIDASGRCNMAVANPTTDVERFLYETARNVLRPEDWFIDLQNGCVVPKETGGSCYGEREQDSNLQVDYAAGTDCGAKFDVFDSDTDEIKEVKANASCPHYVTICYSL